VALKKLNQFTHPRIFQEIQKKINWYKQYSPKDVIIIDAALLIETELKNIVDEIWLITIEKELQRHRLMQRDNLTLEEANKRISAQMSLKEKMPYADKLINNCGDKRNLEEQMKKLWGMINKG
jgi:dephospho-CoA kinase